jgi:hypothetical protein
VPAEKLLVLDRPAQEPRAMEFSLPDRTSNTELLEDGENT